MINKDVLKDVGLTENESEIYLVLLRLGEATIYQISEHSKISRPNIYDIVNVLYEKGLVSFVVKNNKKYYKPVAPERLIDILKEKENNLTEVLPKLNKLYEEKTKKPIVEVFEGPEGLKTIMNDMIKYGKNILIFNGIDMNYLLENIPDFNVKRFLNEKKKKKIKTKILYSSDTKPIQGVGYSLKRLPQNNLSCVSYWTYGDRVAIGIWSNPLIIIRIIDKNVAETYRQGINLVWNSIKK